MRTETQISAGGLVLRRMDGGLEIALISTGNPPRWQLPKGLIDNGETAEAAALREVREEAGLTARLDSLVEKVEYWYQASTGGERIRYHKFVYFFLMWYEAGDVSDHDHEVNEARWFPLERAEATLAFRSERTLIAKAIEMIPGDRTQ